MYSNDSSKQCDSAESCEDAYVRTYNDSKELFDYVESDYTWNWKLSYTQRLTIDVIVLVLTLITLIYGVTSWCCLRKFRNYRNYVFLNAILTNFSVNLTIRIWIEWNSFYYNKYVYVFLVQYLATAKTHWLLVISHMCYMDIVKVFNGNIRRRHLKSGLFGWGVPLITSAIYLFVYEYYYDRMNKSDIVFLFLSLGARLIPVTLNCFIYIIIVFSPCRSFNSSAHTASYVWRRFYVATLIFLLSDILLLYQILLEVFEFYAEVNFFMNIFGRVNPLILDIVFIMLRTNRNIWYEFYINKVNERHRDHELIMQRRIVHEAADSHAEVLDV